MKWNFSKTILDSEPYYIQNINIWDKDWKNTGKKINIKDPTNNQDYSFNIYEIIDSGKIITFSAGEFSNNIWGIYEPEIPEPKNRISNSRKLFYIGLASFLLSILMLIFGAGMFVSRGDYSKIILKLAEFCFIFWLPFLYIGIILMIIAFIIKSVNYLKSRI